MLTKDATGKTSNYIIKSAIIHLGRELHYGHYISLVVHDNLWFKYNDNDVSVVSCLRQKFDERKLHTIFGGMNDHGAAAYMLFFERVADQSRQVDRSIIDTFTKSSSKQQF